MCSEFGAKVVNVKLLLKSMPGMFEHSDKNVRAEVSGGVGGKEYAGKNGKL